MLAQLLTGKGIQNNSQNEPSYFYKFTFTQQVIHIHTPVLFDEEPLFRLILGLKQYETLSNYVFHEPIMINGFTLEKKDYDWLISRLSGLKNIEKGKELDFIYSKLTTNYFQILSLDTLLDSDQTRNMLHYMLSNRLFSYQMIFTLFNLLEKKIPISSLVSKRVYQTFLEEVEPFRESLQNDKNWELLSVFISNYHFNEFIKEKQIFPIFDQFLKEIQKLKINSIFNNNGLSKIIRQWIDPKELVLFIGQIPDQQIAAAFDSLEWENFKSYVSSRTYERIKEDIWHDYDPKNSYQARLMILKKLIEFIVRKSPPFYFINKAYDLKTTFNLIFDKIGPIYTAIYLKENEPVQPTILPYLTPFRKTFIEQFIRGKIKKRGGISNAERLKAQELFNFYLAAALILKESWFLIE